MVITQTPFRISFLGGGTDYRPYFMENGGSVISTTIDKYCYINIRKLPPFFNHRSRVTYSQVENFNEIDEIDHPSVRECLRYLDMNDVSITHDGDLPAKTGLATSSAFTVGLLNGLHALRGEYIDSMTLSKEAIHVEQEMIKENVGVQDQLAVAHGGLNRIYFTSEGYFVRPIIISSERKQLLNDSLIMIYTGLSRFASDIAKDQIEITSQKINELKNMCSMVDDGEKILTSNCDINDFGRLLHESWQIKRSLTKSISNDNIDEIYQTAMKNGAIGGKLLGAGGGGFVLLYVEPEKQDKVKHSLSNLLHVPFNFENNGSRVLYYRK